MDQGCKCFGFGPTPGGSYDAIRVYLWAGMMDSGGRLRSQVLSAVPVMSVYLATHDAPPEKVSDQGIPLAQDGPVGFSAAVLPYLRAFPRAAPAADRQMLRIMKAREPFLPWAELQAQLQGLQTAADQNDAPAIKAIFLRHVQGYQSS